MGNSALNPCPWLALALLSLAITGCACQPTAHLRQVPLTLASLPDCLLVGLRCEPIAKP